MQCHFTGAIIYKGQKTASSRNTCWLCDQLDLSLWVSCEPPPAPHTYSTSSQPLTIDQSCWCSSSQCLMLVSEQLACLHPSATQNYVANLSPFSLSLVSLSILLSPVGWRWLFSPPRVWLCDTYNWRCDNFCSFYTNTLYLLVKGCCWKVSNGCMRLWLSSLLLRVCRHVCGVFIEFV